jgi:hypothetical protein
MLFQPISRSAMQTSLFRMGTNGSTGIAAVSKQVVIPVPEPIIVQRYQEQVFTLDRSSTGLRMLILAFPNHFSRGEHHRVERSSAAG